ncbi:MAG: UbiA family prenyltransferase [Hymenobacteraceae bacterium]|nr:UbiA family prenyltransferase [Hymenobacteraceae bacterium]
MPKLFLRLFAPLLDFVLYGHLLLAAAAAALTWSTGELLGQRLPPTLPALAGAATLALYNFDGLVPYKRRQPATSARSRWLQTHPRTLAGLALGGLLATAPLAWQLLRAAPDAWLKLAPLVALAVLYSVPVVPGRPRWRPLRDIPLAKGVLVAAVWTGVTVALPARLGAPPVTAAALALLLTRRFLFVGTLTLVFDLRDVEKDAAVGTRTIPLVLGTRRTRWLGWALLVGCALLRPLELVLLRNPMELSAGATALLGLPLIAAAALVATARPGRHDYYYAGLGDGALLLPALAEWLIGLTG